MPRLSVLLLGAFCMSTFIASAHADTDTRAALESVAHLTNYPVVELRRYDIAPGQRERFVRYFDAYFPEAFEQLDCMVFGQFEDRAAPTKFVWLRGYHDINARPIVDAAFYYGPVWREHRTKVNALFPGASDNVLLLRPLTPQTEIPVLPAVDPVDEAHGARGVVVAQIFAVEKGDEDAFAQRAQAAFVRYANAHVHPAGVLVTLDVPNNFPQLPVRTDGPFLVWLGVVENDAALKDFEVLASQIEQSLEDTGMLRGAPERLVLDPTPRSRLRWWPVADTKSTP
ncbi:MAG: NIPSNAP family protein [Xanthomonadaceae bacterium]|nr:NIPSNAP family protein [Xanthomonadaceae bacterium]